MGSCAVFPSPGRQINATSARDADGRRTSGHIGLVARARETDYRPGACRTGCDSSTMEAGYDMGTVFPGVAMGTGHDQ